MYNGNYMFFLVNATRYWDNVYNDGRPRSPAH